MTAEPEPSYTDRMVALLRDGCTHTGPCLCEVGISLLTRQPVVVADCTCPLIETTPLDAAKPSYMRGYADNCPAHGKARP